MQIKNRNNKRNLHYIENSFELYRKTEKVLVILISKNIMFNIKEISSLKLLAGKGVSFPHKMI